VAGARKKAAPLPSKQQILHFVREHAGKVGKREIARAFQVGDRVGLKKLLRELQDDGALERGGRKKLGPPGTLPDMALVEVIDIDIDGELVARPLEWRGDGAPPRVVLTGEERSLGAIGIGDRVLARLRRHGERAYEGRFVRLVHAAPDEIIGVFSIAGRGEGRIQSTDKKDREEYAVDPDDFGGARAGQVVLAETLPGKVLGLRRAKVKEPLGHMSDPRALSLIAIHKHDIPTQFSEAALAEAAKAKPVALGKRADLRDKPLVTIDPEDARDRDDAVFAEPDSDPKNRGGWHVLVAIADVAHYVRPGSGLDRDARLRGNSAYFPDRVVPMLPEALSSDLCSLHAEVPRACLAVHMWFDRDGHKLRHRFVRGLMRSAAALSYGQVQRAYDERDARWSALLDPLYGAYASLSAAREARQPLAIDLPERKVELGPDGYIKAIRPRERFDAHRLIEEFMIAANVAAAEELERLKQPCMYRVHEEPSNEKVEALREFLDSLDLRLSKGQVLRPAMFNQILKKVAGTEHEQLVNEVVLRTQTQAYYAPNNLGHFGLALRRYAHFTSPIRRYSDLLVHRALIRGLKLGTGALTDEEAAGFEETGTHISRTERRAMTAERDALDRFTAAFLAEQVGSTFHGRVSGVTRFGLFVKLAESGADGLVHIGSLGQDYFMHDEARHALVGRRSGVSFRLGDEVEVELADADPVTGGLKLTLVAGGTKGKKAKRGRR
jgi:ribonuclease R